MDGIGKLGRCIAGPGRPFHKELLRRPRIAHHPRTRGNRQALFRAVALKQAVAYCVLAADSFLRQTDSLGAPMASRSKLAGRGARKGEAAPDCSTPASSGPFVAPVMMGLLAMVS